MTMMMMMQHSAAAATTTASAAGHRGAGASAPLGGGRRVSVAVVGSLAGRSGRGGTSTESRSGGGSGGGDSDSEWMQRARKLANQRAAQFRKERGTQPVAPGNWRRKRKNDKNDEGESGFDAARGYDDLRRRTGEDGEEEEVEMTATAGDGLWRVDMAGLGDEDWATQWTMTSEEWNKLKKETKKSPEVVGPMDALQAFEDAGLRRVSPDIAAGMLKIIANKAQTSRTDREELAGLRRDTRMAHLLGTCVAAARRGSDALSPASVSSAAWALAVVSGERANSAEMEVLADRAAVLVDDMSPRAIVDLTWACASCRHAAPTLFQAIDVRAAITGLKGFKTFDVSTLVWAFAHLGHRADGTVDGLDQWLEGSGASQTSKFTPQALVTTAWSLAVVGGDALRGKMFAFLWGEMGARGREAAQEAEAAGSSSSSAAAVADDVPGEQITFGKWRGKHLNQINQAAVSVAAAGGTEALGLTPLPDELAAAAERAWLAQRRPPVVSWYQRDVASILSYMGEKHEEEAVCGGYRVDLLIPSPVGLSAEDDDATQQSSPGVAVEVDGPSHFARNDAAQALGQTRLKHRQLRHLGFAVLSVPVADWEYLETSEEKVEYLRSGMEHAARLAAGTASAPAL